jgi:DNA-binding beta-propeller fold protein YncE
LLVEQADAQQVVPELAAEPSTILGDGTGGDGDTQLDTPFGAAFIASHPDWLVTTEQLGHRIKISNIRTGALVCKFGKRGHAEGQFRFPSGVAVTSDNSFVIAADCLNHRVQVLQLVVGAESNSAHLEFVRSIGSRYDSTEAKLEQPIGVALLQSNGEQQETVLVTDEDNHGVSKFALDGTFIGIFAGTGESGSDDGEMFSPHGITVLGSSGEVAVADRDNHRVQIFDSEGNYERQFGTEGGEADGQLYTALQASPRMRMATCLWWTIQTGCRCSAPKGKHLCTRSDLGLQGGPDKGIAWSADGEIAVANGEAHTTRLWCQ